MKRKNFFRSKINWAAVILILQALLPLLEKQDFAAMTVRDWLIFAIGVAIIILRTYFTSVPIKAKRKPVKKSRL